MLRRLFGVKCYSVKTKKVFYLFKSELNARYIRADFTNSPIGMAWVLTDELTPSEEVKHPPLDPDQTKYVHDIMSNLKGVYDLSFDEWALGFRKDQNINHQSQHSPVLVPLRSFQIHPRFADSRSAGKG